MCVIQWKTTNADVYKCILLLFFSFYDSKWLSKEENRRQLRCTYRVKYESSVIRFFFVLRSWDWYVATGMHWIILVSSCVYTFVSLLCQDTESSSFLLASWLSWVSSGPSQDSPSFSFIITYLILWVWYISGFSILLTRVQSSTRLVPRAA